MTPTKADIVIPVYGDVAATRACIESVLAHSGPNLGQLIIINDCSPDAGMVPMLGALQDEHPVLLLLENEANLGFVRTANRGIFARQRDVVILNSDTLVTPGWLGEMLEVAYSSDRVSCVAPLSNNATICSVPAFAEETKAEALPFERAGLAASALPQATEAPTGVGFCLLLKDAVIDMIGAFDPVFGRGYNEENDWVMRAQEMGFVAMRANRALVYHLGEASFGSERTGLEEVNARVLQRRHPHYLPQVSAFCDGPEARVAAHYVRRRLGKLSVRLDLRYMHTPAVNGTAVYALELAKNLRDHTSFEVSACVANRDQARLLAEAEIPTMREDEPLGNVQVLHRPAQFFDARELSFYLNSTAHTVITFQDLIAYHAPTVFSSYAEFARYRAASYAALHASQAVIAISEHSRQEILREMHVAPDRVHTVHHGVSAEAFERRDSGHNSRILANHAVDRPFLLYTGSDYPHKNLRLVLAAYARFRSLWQGPGDPPALVLVGPPSGSQVEVYRHLAREPQPGVRYLGTVPGEAMVALYQEASALVFLSAYEGFGLPVLEAMAAGTPVICSHLTSIPEVAGDAALYVTDYRDEGIARRLLEVIADEELRRRLVAKGRERARAFSWKETAQRTAEIYLEVIDRPSPATLCSRKMLANLLTTSPS